MNLSLHPTFPPLAGHALLRRLRDLLIRVYTPKLPVAVAGARSADESVRRLLERYC